MYSSLSNANTKDQTLHGDRESWDLQITVVLTSNEFSKTRQKFLYKCKHTAHSPRLENGFVT